MPTRKRSVAAARPFTTDDLIELIRTAGPSPDFAVTIARARAEREHERDGAGSAYALWGTPGEALAAAGWLDDDGDHER
jgi:hypothetical protein